MVTMSRSSFIAAFAASIAVPGTQGRSGDLLSSRALEGSNRELQSTTMQECSMRAARVLPTPSLDEYEKCLQNKVVKNSTHDWGLPGAEFTALIDCWCSANLTQTINDYGCCDHPSFRSMCRVQCQPDCTSFAADQCIQDCPAMCLEANEYIVEHTECARCNAEACFPVTRCLTSHAEALVDSGDLARTCHEVDFRHSEQLKQYWQCWHHMPKHSSHWNVLSSVMHCSCREGMPEMASNTDCCDSLTFGGGVCKSVCPTEEECSGQDAQSCIHSCNALCPSVDPTPSAKCQEMCLRASSPCRRFLGCRPPMLPTDSYVCDDGQMPEASTGCCIENLTESSGAMAGCPKLCETHFVWRMDKEDGTPWWARWNTKEGIVYQCTCGGCPERTEAATEEVKKTLEESIWDNGQVMLVDIARREGLQLGPNRRMQLLMAERNSAISDMLKVMSNENRIEVEQRITRVNAEYASLISNAAREFPDDGGPPEEPDVEDQKTESEPEQTSVLLGILLGCALAVVCALLWAIVCLLHRRRTTETPVTGFANEQVVIGSPVAPPDSGEAGLGKGDGVVSGAAVTVSAPMKTRAAVELS